MNSHSSLAIFCALMIHYGIGYAHLVDCHLSNPAEEIAMERAQREVQNQKDLEVIRDKESSFEEKVEAFERLFENEGML